MEKSHDVRKNQIIKAALDIIAERGVNRLTTAEVSKRVGFSEGALFRYFPSKLEMIRGAMEYAHAEIFAGINLITNQNSGPLTKLEEILFYHISYLSTNKGVPRLIFSTELQLMDEDIRKNVYESHQKYLGTIISVIEEGISCGIFRNNLDAKIAAEAVFGLILTTQLADSLGEFNSHPQEQFASISRFLRRCFINRGCPGKQRK